ncbi:MAG: KRRI-Interacting protein 1 [Bogoriella megaspora]|nr:MAG: KRRI-Interacting protein 1 [Bogoriella megaspora]
MEILNALSNPQKRRNSEIETEPPTKRTKLLLEDSDLSGDSDNESSKNGSDSDDGGVRLGGTPPGDWLKINAEYAKRFEHNKKREDQQRLEEKYGKANGNTGDGSASNSDESSEESDDEGLLATEELDAEIIGTLDMIKSKDPRIYIKSRKFYKDFDPDDTTDGNEKEEKPMYLQDYHRKNLLEGYTGDSEDEEMQEMKVEGQSSGSMKRQLVEEMHAAAVDAEGGSEHPLDEDDEDNEFLKAKPPAQGTDGDRDSEQAQKPKKHTAPTLDPAAADQDPETYLSNFMVSRAWVPDAKSHWQPFDSDDSEEEARADAFEEAYNMRFEDPELANEKLVSHARDAAAKYSVRREEPKARKKARDKEREKKDEAKRQVEEEKARLRKYRVEEVADKVKKIKEAAGLGSKDVIDMKEWEAFLEDGWDDEKWDAEMQKRFGENYYAEDEEKYPDEDAITEQASGKHKKGIRKPKWNDDIEIKDLVPDYDDEDPDKPAFTLTDDENEEDSEIEDDANKEEITSKKPKSKKDRLQARSDAKRAARKERRVIESLIDNDLSLLNPATSSRSTETPRFRYRDTSPSAFGLTARDILLADDAQLNQFAGLKKLAAFRDQVKKGKDRKRLGKKARLREWRKETFGDVEGAKGGFKGDSMNRDAGKVERSDFQDEGKKGKKRKRGKRGKGNGEVKIIET